MVRVNNVNIYLCTCIGWVVNAGVNEIVTRLLTWLYAGSPGLVAVETVNPIVNGTAGVGPVKVYRAIACVRYCEACGPLTSVHVYVVIGKFGELAFGMTSFLPVDCCLK